MQRRALFFRTRIRDGHLCKPAAEVPLRRDNLKTVIRSAESRAAPGVKVTPRLHRPACPLVAPNRPVPRQDLRPARAHACASTNVVDAAVAYHRTEDLCIVGWVEDAMVLDNVVLPWHEHQR